jgi:hypothetical protein
MRLKNCCLSVHSISEAFSGEGDKKSGGILREAFSAAPGRKRIAQRFIAGYVIVAGQVPRDDGKFGLGRDSG